MISELTEPKCKFCDNPIEYKYEYSYDDFKAVLDSHEPSYKPSCNHPRTSAPVATSVQPASQVKAQAKAIARQALQIVAARTKR
jgi:hypothetical protein